MSKNNEIITKVLSMDESQLKKLLVSLSPEVLDYLDLLLQKAERDSVGLKKYIDSK